MHDGPALAIRIIPALWAIFWIYWLIAARHTKPTSRRESPAARASHVIPLIVAFGLFYLPGSWGGWLFARFLPRSSVGYWIGVALVAAGLAFAIWARRHLGRNWSGMVTLKEDHTLTRSGPYRWVRNPIYTGIVLGMLGTAIAVGQWRGLIAVAITVASFIRKIRIEERLMRETFPDEYPRYRADVPAALSPFTFLLNRLFAGFDEPHQRPGFSRVAELPGIARQENQPAIVIVGDAALVGVGETLQLKRAVRLDPAGGH